MERVSEICLLVGRLSFVTGLCKGSYALYTVCAVHVAMSLGCCSVVGCKIVFASKPAFKLSTKEQTLKSGACHLLGKRLWRLTAVGHSIPVTAGAHTSSLSFVCIPPAGQPHLFLSTWNIKQVLLASVHSAFPLWC